MAAFLFGMGVRGLEPEPEPAPLTLGAFEVEEEVLELEVIPMDSPEGLCGIVPALEALVLFPEPSGDGEAGRDWKLLLMGVMGVLLGRSMGTVKFLKLCSGEPADGPSYACPFLPYAVGGLLEAPLPTPTPIGPVGTEGKENAGSSSNSSMEGKAWLNPLMLIS